MPKPWKPRLPGYTFGGFETVKLENTPPTIEWTKCPTCESSLWECPTCQLSNPPGRKKCKGCGYWRVK